MKVVSGRNKRLLRVETLESRALMSATPLAAAAPASGAAAVQSSGTAGETVIPIHLQVGQSALSLALGMATQISSLEQAVDAYLGAIPGWHLTGSIDKTPPTAGESTAA
jgi:hypothetical protein